MKSALTLSFLMLTSISFGQNISGLKLNNELSILKDRIYLSFPDSSENIARTADIMSHGPNAEKETRIVFNNGDERLVFFAQELSLLANENLYETVKGAQNENYAFEYAKVKRKKELTIIKSTPTKWDDTQDAILINSLTVMTKDSSLLRIDAYINPFG